MLTLGLESTCDESSTALLVGQRGLVANVVKSQVQDHRRFGGVVPEIASRLHLNLLRGTVEEALEKSAKKLADVDLIAFSHRPGLIGGLMVGATLAKTLSYLLDRPLVAVDHMLGHLLAPDLDEPMAFPCIGGVFSGGHSNIYLGLSPTDWKLLVRTRDDAPGESFDKTAKLMGLPYPGGPAIQSFAADNDPKAFDLPLPLPRSLEGDFSFSGLKTSVLYHLKGTNGKTAVPENRWPSLAAAFQDVIAQAISRRMVECAQEHQVHHLYLGGGVAANARLRQVLMDKAEHSGLAVRFPSLPLCMDNGAMIARAGRVLFDHGQVDGLDVEVASRSTLGMDP